MLVTKEHHLPGRASPRRRVASLAKATMLVCSMLVLLLAATTGAQAATVARGSVEQVDVTGAAKGATLRLVTRAGRVVATRRAGALGGAIFRDVAPGRGYRIRHGSAKTPAVTVLSQRSAPPSTARYRQKIPKSGYGYLTTRDGTKLAIDVHLPSGSGPFPTLVEYAGYGYADPAGPQSGIAKIANLLGFAVVDVNMRGTGCSGGAYDFFEPLQGLDGYDVIETVAHQSWVKSHKVGMMGISYGAISQLFVAETRPPDLAAIAPLSVFGNPQATLYPGGILNTGFALAWAKERDHDAMPASATGGQAWALQRIKEGDATCKANQALHEEAVSLVDKIRASSHYDPKIDDPLTPTEFVHKITVPVYMACQWTDEQTGGHCPDLVEHFTGTTRKWFTFTNGVHTDSLDPATLNRWFDFLELYVAHQAPRLPPGVAASAPLIYSTALGIPDVHLPDDPLQSEPDYASALAAFQALPPVRVLFDNGAGGSAPGQPLAGFEQSFARFPIPGTEARSWYLGPGGTLADDVPSGAGTDVFTWRAGSGPTTDFSGDTGSKPGGLWTATPSYHWTLPAAANVLSYLTPPLAEDTTVIGAGAVAAWIKESVPSADLQVTVSEVRPDGNETFVQSGWLRPSERALDAEKSTPLEPVPSFRKVDVAPLPAGTWTKVTIPLYYEGHAYRAGSQLRITISAPGGDQPVWAFAHTVPATGTAKVSLAYGPATPSRIVLPVVPGVAVPTPLPPCPGLRGEPCRTYQPLSNAGPPPIDPGPSGQPVAARSRP